MCFQDVAFPHCRANFPTIFLENYGRGECLETTTCLRTVFGGKQVLAPCKMLLLHNASFLCQSNLMEIMRLLQG